MNADINSREDIDALMVDFYGRAMKDPVIGSLFTDVARLDLAHHLPVIGDFWESALFGTGVYAKHRRNPLLVHAELDRMSRLEPHHFEQWVALFSSCVDASFAGTRAEHAKFRGQMIARRMMEYLAATRS